MRAALRQRTDMIIDTLFTRLLHLLGVSSDE